MEILATQAGHVKLNQVAQVVSGRTEDECQQQWDAISLYEESPPNSSIEELPKRISRIGILPPEVLSLITECLSGYEIGRLYMSGDGSLRRTMTVGGGVTKFTLDVATAFSLQWPKLASQFLHLSHFRYRVHPSYAKCPIRGVDFRSLPTTVRILELHFYEAIPAFFSLLMGSEGSRWNSIQVLRLNEETLANMGQAILGRAPILTLPSSLQSIDVLMALPLSSIRHLPRTLTSAILKIGAEDGNTEAIEIEHWQLDPMFPISLTRLHVHAVYSLCVFKFLPPSTTDLELEILHSFFAPLDDPTTFDPSQASSDPPPSSIFGFEWLPSNLKTLCLTWPYDISPSYLQILTRSDFAALPRSITDFRCSYNIVYDDNSSDATLFSSLPAGLKRFEIQPLSFTQYNDNSDSRPKSSLMTTLPKDLNVLSVSLQEEYVIQDTPFPPLLRSIALDRFPVDLALPSTAITFNGPDRAEITERILIPKFLTSLSIKQSNLDQQAATALPSTLTELYVKSMISSLDIESDHDPIVNEDNIGICIEAIFGTTVGLDEPLYSPFGCWAFPASLTDLEVQEDVSIGATIGIHTHLRQLHHVVLPMELGPLLPTTVTSASLNAFQSHSMPLIPHLKALKTLRLFGSTLRYAPSVSLVSSIPASGPPSAVGNASSFSSSKRLETLRQVLKVAHSEGSADLRSYLPPSLTYLHLENYNTDCFFPPEILWQLDERSTPLLRCLFVGCIRGLKDEHLALLPPGLRELVIVRFDLTDSLTTKCLLHMPKSIASIRIPWFKEYPQLQISHLPHLSKVGLLRQQNVVYLPIKAPTGSFCDVKLVDETLDYV